MSRFHYAASQEPELSFFRIALPATAFRYQSLQCAGERTSLLFGIYNMLKNSQTESFFQKFFIFFFFSRRAYARQIIQTSAFSQQTQSSAASLYVGYSLPLGEQQKPLPVLCTSSGTKSSTGISLNLSRFLIFLHIFFPPYRYRCIGIFLNLSLSALIPDGREEQSVCSVLVAPCIRSSSCSFLIAVVVASSINANLSLSIFFLPFCSLVSLLHIQYARILRCGYFFCGFFCVLNFPEFGFRFGLYTKSKAALVAKRFLPHENEIAKLNIMRKQGVQSSMQFVAGCKFTGFR